MFQCSSNLLGLTVYEERGIRVYEERGIRVGHATVWLLRVILYLFVLVERVNDEFHHSVDLSLVFVFLSSVTHLLHLRYVQTVQLDSFLLPEKIWISY